MRFPVGSKYVLESRGSFIRRYIEYPNGRTVELTTRKAVPCRRSEFQQIGIVPEHAGPVDTPSISKKLKRERAT